MIYSVSSARQQQRRASPPPQGNLAGGRHQEPGASPSMHMGMSGSHTAQRHQNALGLYIADPPL
ncbi:hypothetical protein FRC01_003322 [Tulasnella sp. 417]|nr:hypothetical protein FRC01_003322 [Tulasnella sp. 417]